MNKMDRTNFDKVIDRLFFLAFAIFMISLPMSRTGEATGLALGLICWLCSIISKKKIYLLPKSKIVGILVLVFISTLLIATIVSGISINSLDGLRRLLSCIVFFFLVTQGIKDEIQIKKLVSMLIISSTIISIYGIVQYFTGLNISGWEGVKAFGRVHGICGANTLGGVLGMVVPICLSNAFFLKRKLYWICLGLMTICLGLTLCRGGWMGSVAGVMFMLFIYNKKLLLVLIAILISTFLLWSQGRTRIINTFKFKEGSETVRRHMWQTAITMAKQKPVFGHGPLSFPKIFEELDPIEKGHKHCHNIYLGLAAETGVLGLMSFLILVGYAFVLNFQLFNRIPYSWPKFLCLGMAGSIIDFLVHGLVDYTLYGTTGFLFSFWLGVIAFLYNKLCSLNIST